ncbi:hypothetical protein C8R43DRAFT_942960 [Mycena crocata]|nr:hypothetical protein C8R43DRAFT_942960 [Mycena crocata]
MSDPKKKPPSSPLQDDPNDLPELEPVEDSNDDLPDLVDASHLPYHLPKNSKVIPAYVRRMPLHTINPSSPLAAVADTLISSGLLISYDLNFQLKARQFSRCGRPCAVPKWHAACHSSNRSVPPACLYHGEYLDSYYYYIDSALGCTDGVAIEREWAALNPDLLSTQEMGPGARQAKL